MNSKQFLHFCGMILVLLGMLGYVLPGGELLGMSWYLTTGENVAHIFIGVVAMSGAFVFDDHMQKILVRIIATIAVFFAVFGFLVRDVSPLNTFGVANLENPYDNLLHLIVGLWGVYAGFIKQKQLPVKPAAK